MVWLKHPGIRDSKEKEKIVLLTILGGCALLVAFLLLRGYALSVLWGWFVVPTLHLPALSVVQAIGIALVVSFLTYVPHHTSYIPKKGQSTREAIRKAATMAILYQLFVLLFGWVVHQFM